MQSAASTLFDDLLPQGQRRVILYCPEALVGPHLRLLQFVGRVLKDYGHEVFLTYCDHLFPRCVAKESLSMPGGAPVEYNQQVCNQCTATLHQLAPETDIAVFQLSQAISPALVQRAVEILAATPDEQLAGFTYDGVAFGQMCRADMLSTYKLMIASPLGAEHYTYLREYIASVVAAYAGLVDFLPRSGITDILAYGDYSSNLAAFAAATKHGINWRLIHSVNHLQTDRRRLFVVKGQFDLVKAEMLKRWPDWRDFPLKAGEVAEIAVDIRMRLGGVGFTTYSPGKSRGSDILGRLGLDPAKKTLVVYTSSLDEFNAGEVKDMAIGQQITEVKPRAFADQIEWLQALMEWVGARGDLQLVVRVHPREDSNKRDPISSQHLKLLRESFSWVPANARMVWPADPVSSYDLMEAAAAVLVWISTTGLEAARLGVPVIRTHPDFPNYPVGDFALSARDKDGYFAALEEALAAPPRFERLLWAWRFYAYSRFAWAFDLRDSIPDVAMQQMPPYQRPEQAEEILSAIASDLASVDIKERRAHAHHERLSAEAEAAAIRGEAARLFGWLMTGGDLASEIGGLTFGDVPEDLSDLAEGAVLTDGRRCAWKSGETVYRADSPMAARLVQFAAGLG